MTRDPTSWVQRLAAFRNDGSYEHMLLDALVNGNDGKLRGLADSLDRLADNCSEAAVKSRTQENAEYLLARASTYQECAGLIREALK